MLPTLLDMRAFVRMNHVIFGRLSKIRDDCCQGEMFIMMPDDDPYPFSLS